MDNQLTDNNDLLISRLLVQDSLFCRGGYDGKYPKETLPYTNMQCSQYEEAWPASKPYGSTKGKLLLRWYLKVKAAYEQFIAICTWDGCHRNTSPADYRGSDLLSGWQQMKVIYHTVSTT